MSNPLAKKVGAFMRLRMGKMNMTIPQVAKKSNLALSVVQNVVAGRADCRLSTLKKLSTALRFKITLWWENSL